MSMMSREWNISKNHRIYQYNQLYYNVNIIVN